jgi:hypothetical protein
MVGSGETRITHTHTHTHTPKFGNLLSMATSFQNNPKRQKEWRKKEWIFTSTVTWTT